MSGSFAPIDFRTFHEDTLPAAISAGRGALAAEDDLVRVGALAFRMPDGAAYTYRPRTDGIDLVPGDDGADVVVELEPELWSQLVHDLESAPGLLYAGRCNVRRGDAMRFVRWEPSLRALYHGRPIFRPERVDLRDRRGSALDVGRAFSLESDREDMAHFLRTAGFLLVKDVFSADEVARFVRCAEEKEAAAREGDKRSWWGRNADGESVLCRVTHCEDAEALGGLPEDPRITGLAALSDAALVARTHEDEDGIGILRKNPGMVQGLSDLPWHRDCGMGGHASQCPRLIVSILPRPVTPRERRAARAARQPRGLARFLRGVRPARAARRLPGRRSGRRFAPLRRHHARRSAPHRE